MTLHISYLVLAAKWLKTTDNTSLRAGLTSLCSYVLFTRSILLSFLYLLITHAMSYPKPSGKRACTRRHRCYHMDKRLSSCWTFYMPFPYLDSIYTHRPQQSHGKALKHSALGPSPGPGAHRAEPVHQHIKGQYQIVRLGVPWLAMTALTSKGQGAEGAREGGGGQA